MHRPPPPETLATRVTIAGGTGTADSQLTAFDAALYDAGLHDANLLAISSIVPADAVVIDADDRTAVERVIEPGAFVPAVYAFEASDRPGDRVHAAVAGARLEAGYGINVEHHGVNEDTHLVRQTCEAMLEEMATVRRTALTDDAWFRCEAVEVPDDGRWAGAVAAMAYSTDA